MKFNQTKVTFKQGKHSTSGYTKKKLTLQMWFKKQVRCKVYFTDKSKYDLKGYDQWNKILGTSKYLLPKIKHMSDFEIFKYDLFDQITFRKFQSQTKNKLKKYLPKFLFIYTLVPSQHITSQRLVYRYNLKEDCFELSTKYIYDNMKRKMPEAGEYIKVFKNKYGVYESPVFFIDKLNYFNLTPYFGGQKKSPNMNNFLIELI